MLVSVVIPCYNVEADVFACLESVAAQTYDHLEVICVDDGSTDGTVQVIQAAMSMLRLPVRLLEGPNRGAPAARNRGLATASGEYVQFLDADDILQPTKIEHQVELIEEAARLPALVVGAYRFLRQTGEETFGRGATGDPWRDLIGSSLGNTCSNLWSRTYLQAAGGWDEQARSSQEYDLMFRILQQGAYLRYDDVPLTLIQRRTGSISLSNRGANRIRHIELRLRILEHLRVRGLATPELEALAYQVIFRAIRELYWYDPAKALELHGELIPPRFSPGGEGSGPLYRLLYRALGFRRTQQLYTRFDRQVTSRAAAVPITAHDAAAERGRSQPNSV
jgi:glycosyltransferase involved in cell wall biosynthesis